MFFKKKEKTSFQLVHYEGLHFNQDFPCEVSFDTDCLIFKSDNQTAKLKFDQLRNAEYMKEVQYMGKYHNNPVSTAKCGVKHFCVIHYKASTGDDKYIAVWTVGMDAINFVEKLSTYIKPTEIEL